MQQEPATCDAAICMPVLDLCCHRHKCLLNIGGIFCASLQEWDANLICKGLQASRNSHQSAAELTGHSDQGSWQICETVHDNIQQLQDRP